MKKETSINWRAMFGNDKNRKGALHFPRSAIDFFYRKIKDICDEKKVAFSVCFDSGSNYEYFRKYWNNENDCCNGQGNVKEFKTNFQMIK